MKHEASAPKMSSPAITLISPLMLTQGEKDVPRDAVGT